MWFLVKSDNKTIQLWHGYSPEEQKKYPNSKGKYIAEIRTPYIDEYAEEIVQVLNQYEEGELNAKI